MTIATYADAFREYAMNAGQENPQQPWILTPWDTWEKNPWYTGSAAPHPESDEDDLIEDQPYRTSITVSDDDIPF